MRKARGEWRVHGVEGQTKQQEEQQMEEEVKEEEEEEEEERPGAARYNQEPSTGVLNVPA